MALMAVFNLNLKINGVVISRFLALLSLVRNSPGWLYCYKFLTLIQSQSCCVKLKLNLKVSTIYRLPVSQVHSLFFSVDHPPPSPHKFETRRGHRSHSFRGA